MHKHFRNYFQLISAISDTEVRPYLSVILIQEIQIHSDTLRYTRTVKEKLRVGILIASKICNSEISQAVFNRSGYLAY